MEETRICKDCGKELPIDRFQKCKNGHRINTCKACQGKRVSEAKKTNNQSKEANRGDYRDPELDGKTPREVQEILARAARWLNNYGGFTCKVELTYEKTIPLAIR